MADLAGETRSSKFCRVPWDTIVLAMVGLFVAAIALVPFGRNCTAVEGQSWCEQNTLLQSEGLATIAWIAAPSLAVALLPVVVRHWIASTITAVLLSILAILGIFSIGILVAPVALTAWLGVACRRSGTSAR